jgi:hypothetical protein
MKIETVSYQLDWNKFRVGQSVFVPCIDHVAARRTLAAVTKRLKISTVTKVVIVDGVKGLRIWRT